MFLNHAPLLFDRHAPNVVADLTEGPIDWPPPVSYVAESSCGREVMPRVIYPPFDFAWCVRISSSGEVQVEDDLPSGTSLVCQSRDFKGHEIPFDAECFASAWAYLLYTPRLVFGRPTSDQGLMFDGGAERLTLALSSSLEGISLGEGADGHLSFLACGREILARVDQTDQDFQILSDLGRHLTTLAKPRDALFAFDLELGRDGHCRVSNSFAIGSVATSPYSSILQASMDRQTYDPHWMAP